MSVGKDEASSSASGGGGVCVCVNSYIEFSGIGRVHRERQRNRRT